MASSMQQLVLVVALVCVTFLSAGHGLEMYDAESSDSNEYTLGEENRLPYPYPVHGKPPPLGECGDCGFVIVEKRHHYCIPGKSVIKVLRRKPTCNCKTPNLGHGFYGSESNVKPQYAPLPGSQGPSPLTEGSSDQVSRMLRTLINDRSNYGEVDKAATPQYRTLDSSSAPRTFN